MDTREAIDHQFKKIYGRTPSVAERQQFMKNRPRKIYITTEDHDRIISDNRSKSWKEQSIAEKVREGKVRPGTGGSFDIV